MIAKLTVGLTIGLAAAALALLAAALPFARTVELETYDWRMRRVANPAAARADIVLVRIDERTIANLEKMFGRWPWPRVAHAAVVDFLARGPAKVIAYDVLFTEHDRTRFRLEEEEWTGEESDGALAESVARAGNVVLTKNGNVVVVPNSTISKEAITNYSEPDVPTRIHIDVGASYDAAPNDVKQTILTALRDCSLVLRAPAPDVLLNDFASSSITYRVRFWVADYYLDEPARDQVRSAVYYAFKRQAIEIPYPMQVEYARQERPPRTNQRGAELEALVGGVDLFAGLSDEERMSVVNASAERIFGDGQTIVQQGDAGRSMFVITLGSVSVVIEPSGTEVARLTAGDYFGEMTLLTGEPRTATVKASGDCRVLEITAEVIRGLAVVNPQTLDRLSVIVASRRAELEQVRASAQARIPSQVEPSRTLLARIQQFLGV